MVALISPDESKRCTLNNWPSLFELCHFLISDFWVTRALMCHLNTCISASTGLLGYDEKSLPGLIGVQVANASDIGIKSHVGSIARGKVGAVVVSGLRLGLRLDNWCGGSRWAGCAGGTGVLQRSRSANLGIDIHLHHIEIQKNQDPNQCNMCWWVSWRHQRMPFVILLSVLKRVANEFLEWNDTMTLDLLRVNERRVLLGEHGCGQCGQYTRAPRAFAGIVLPCIKLTPSEIMTLYSSKPFESNCPCYCAEGSLTCDGCRLAQWQPWC